jgi:L-cysteine desulfidase|eukprot:COSAG06_NODE_2112_length_7564_cov_4.547354_2_plen_47_part_00
MLPLLHTIVEGDGGDTATVIFVTVYAEHSALDDEEWAKTIKESENH